MRKNKKNKIGESAQSATRGEWLRARQVGLIVARLPKEHSLISCSCERERAKERTKNVGPILYSRASASGEVESLACSEI